MFISAEEAKKKALNAALMLSMSGELEFSQWNSVVIGEPVLVRDLQGNPGYWLVPIKPSGQLKGFARITGTGEVAAIGALNGASMVTGLSGKEALERVVSTVPIEEGETLQEPVFVYDGSPGREAWLIQTKKEGEPQRWIFVTPAFIYERKAGQLPDMSKE